MDASLKVALWLQLWLRFPEQDCVLGCLWKPGRADGRFCSILGPSQFGKLCLFAGSSQASPLGPPHLPGPFTQLQSSLFLSGSVPQGSQPAVSGTWVEQGSVPGFPGSLVFWCSLQAGALGLELLAESGP